MPPKRKDRPKSSSSDAFSPEEKKSKEANRSTSTSEGEDEVLTALSMADDLGKKVDMILNKLQKLDNIEARLDNLHKSIASLEEAAQPISAESIRTNYSLTVTTFLEINLLLFFLLSSNIQVG